MGDPESVPVEQEPVEQPVEPGPEPSPEPAEPDTEVSAKPAKRMSVKESIRDAIAKASKPTDKTPVKGAAAPGPKAGEQVPAAPAPATAMPDAWKAKELSSVWSGLTPAVQAAIVKREADMQKGVDQLKARHQELDNAVAPYRETIRRFGFTEPQAINQLFQWQMALAGPDKIRAFVALLQSHGVDPPTFAAAITGGAQPQSNQPQQLHPQYLQELEGIKNRLGYYDTQFAQQSRTSAEQTINNWAKDKPHYEKVKMSMGRYISSGDVSPSSNDPYALDAAYNAAIWANPETRELMMEEQRTKEAADRKATAEKARKAGQSMRTGAPVPPVANQANGAANTRNEAVRDSIKRALAELRQ